MEDFTAPSFSLGFDLDFDPNPQSPPQPEPIHTQTQQIPIELSSQSTESDEEIQLEKTLQHAQVEDPPPPCLKRLKRGPPKHLPVGVDEKKKGPVLLSSNLDNDDEIEDFSSPEDSFGGGHSFEPKHSVCSSSKFALNGHNVLNTKIVNKQKTCSDTPASKSSITSKLEATENKLMFPKLTISPIRRFQLLDSDSDVSVAEEEHDKPDKVNVFGKERSKPTESMAGNQEKKSKHAASTPTQDLWKDFSPVKNVNLRTSVTNRFYKENVRPEKGKNIFQNNEGNIPFGFSSGNTQKSTFHVDLSDPLPPSHNYFYRGDLRIQSLVRERLPNFTPLSAGYSRGNIHSDTAIAYMSQFGHKISSSQLHKSGNNNHKGHSNTDKNTRSSYTQGATIAPGDWVNTNSRPNVSSDACRRRVHADCRSAGQWYTGQDGTRVYVSKSGQTMTGHTAYRQYRKECGVGFQRSSKEVASKKK